MHKSYCFPIGPQHPSLKEPIFLNLYLKGTIVDKADFNLGYAHRGVEEKLEKKTLDSALHAAQRTCGICSQCHSLAFLRTVEGLGKIEVPFKVHLQRIMVAELERIHSHVLWTGVMMHELGLETLFMYYWREREKILDVFDKITGNRVHHSTDLVGTMKMDFTEEDIRMLLNALEEVEPKIIKYRKVLTTHDVIRDRCIGKGLITRKDAEKYGLVGPVARASGVNYDVRVNSPYMGYKEVKVKPVIRKEGDAFARMLVRSDEVLESIRLLRECCKKLPMNEKVPKYVIKIIKEGEGNERVEAPRGENFYFVRIRDTKVARAKIRTPTLANLSFYQKVVEGYDLTDVPVVVMSMDPCISCMERAAVIRNGKREIWTSHELFRGKKDD